MTHVLLMITKPEIGGATRNVRDLAIELTRIGHRVTVLSSEEQGWLREQVEAHGCVYRSSTLFKAQISLIHDLLFIIWLRRFLIEQGIDVLHVHSSKAGVLGRIAGFLARTSRIIFTVHGVSFQEKFRRPVRLFYMLAEKLSYYLSDAVVCVSEHDRRRYVGALGDGCGKVSTVRNELLDFPVKARKDNPIPVLGFLGRFVYQKDPKLFIDSLIHLRRISREPFTAIIKGGGPLKGELEKMVLDHRLTELIRFEEEDDKVADFLSRVDILVMTSRFEGYPYTLLEGKAAGCFLVVSDVGGCREIVADKDTGLLFDYGSIESCAQAMEQSLTLFKQNRRQPDGNAYQRYFSEILKIYRV